MASGGKKSSQDPAQRKLEDEERELDTKIARIKDRLKYLEQEELTD